MSALWQNSPYLVTQLPSNLTYLSFLQMLLRGLSKQRERDQTKMKNHLEGPSWLWNASDVNC